MQVQLFGLPGIADTHPWCSYDLSFIILPSHLALPPVWSLGQKCPGFQVCQLVLLAVVITPFPVCTKYIGKPFAILAQGLFVILFTRPPTPCGIDLRLGGTVLW